MKREKESGKAMCSRRRQGIWENRDMSNSQKIGSQYLIDGMHLSCVSQCFNLRSAVSEKGDCLGVAESPLSAAPIDTKLLT